MSISQVTPPIRGRPRSVEKLQRALDAAARQFLDNGFDRTSMDSVAQEAGISKVTLYNYYPSKQALFAAVVSRLSDQVSGMAVLDDLDPRQPEAGLRRLGAYFLQLMRHPRVVAQERILFGLAGTHPDICQAFYREGPARVIRGAAIYLRATHDVQTLHVSDPEVAADQFLSMLLGGANFRVLLGMVPPSREEDSRHLQACVATMLKAFAKSS